MNSRHQPLRRVEIRHLDRIGYPNNLMPRNPNGVGASYR
jgi:hypothetical protein